MGREGEVEEGGIMPLTLSSEYIFVAIRNLEYGLKRGGEDNVSVGSHTWLPISVIQGAFKASKA